MFGHISLETLEHYVSFWPKNGFRKDLNDAEGEFSTGYSTDRGFEGHDCEHFKLVRSGITSVREMNAECQRIGAINKRTGGGNQDGLKKIWTIAFNANRDRDSPSGTCASVVSQVLEAGSVGSATRGWLEASVGVAYSVLSPMNMIPWYLGALANQAAKGVGLVRPIEVYNQTYNGHLVIWRDQTNYAYFAREHMHKIKNVAKDEVHESAHRHMDCREY